MFECPSCGAFVAPESGQCGACGVPLELKMVEVTKSEDVPYLRKPCPKCTQQKLRPAGDAIVCEGCGHMRVRPRNPGLS